MREIKFRAWDKKEKKMCYLDNPHWSLCSNFDGALKVFNFQDGSGGDEYDIMQSTGLYDVNELEIYEGDIVTHNGHIDWRFPMEIKFLDGAFCIGKSGMGKSEFNSWCTLRDTISFSLKATGELPKFKIVGNIHENPELLD